MYPLYAESIPVVPQYDGPLPGRCAAGSNTDCGQHPNEPELTLLTSGMPRTPVAFRGLGVSPRSFRRPWVRGDWGPHWAWKYLPDGAPVEGRAPGFEGLGTLGAANTTLDPNYWSREVRDGARLLVSLAGSASNPPVLGKDQYPAYQLLQSAATILANDAVRNVIIAASLGTAGPAIEAFRQAWRAFRNAACGTGSGTSTTIASALSTVASVLAPLGHVDNPTARALGTAGRAIGQVAGSIDRLRQEVVAACGSSCSENGPCRDASRCPPGTFFVATRSVPEGGMCVTEDAYRNALRMPPVELPGPAPKSSKAMIVIGVGLLGAAIAGAAYALAR